MRRVTRSLLAALLAATVVACSGPSDLDATALATPTLPTTAGPSASSEPADHERAAHEPALVARALGTVDVHDAPNADPGQVLPEATTFGFQTVLLVTEVGTGQADGWLEVLLPVRPNGTTGWIRADEVELREVDLEVHVDLDARELTVLEAGEVVLTTPTAIGDPDHPTPTGRFWVTDKIESDDPTGPYGPYAIGLSARSEVLTEFAGGDGQVGIHGTNNPASIGQAASHGCLRIDNGIVAHLAHLLPLGTPVTIS